MGSITRTPEDIKLDVINQLQWDDRFDASGIFIETHGSEILLTGTVPSYTARSQAMIVAAAVNGVTRVDNRLGVLFPDTRRTFDDADIKTLVQNDLAWNRKMHPARIRVSVHEGAVTLAGAVDSYGQKKQAEIIADNIPGVIAVNNELRIEPEAPMGDEAIRSEILAALQKSTNVDEKQVHVEVSRGAVTLSGEVPDAQALHRTAELAAYARGTAAVDNRLTLPHA